MVMKLKQHFALWMSCLALWSLQAQVPVRNAQELEALQASPLETLFAHMSGNTFLPGEYLYFSLYCINAQTYRVGGVSSLAYVQLIGEDGRVYRRQKLRLNGGRGQGDLFIGTDLPSGAYKLIAYTRWMLNAGAGQLFMADISVINPYQQDQSAILGESGSSIVRVPAVRETVSRVGTDGLALEMDTSLYGRRSNARLQVRNFRGNRGYGQYSLSIARLPDLPGAPLPSATGYSESYPELLREIPQKVGQEVVIPEQRGELIGGQLTPADPAKSAADTWVGLSFPGESFQLKAARTDADGRFFTYLNTPFTGNLGIAEVLNPNGMEYGIQMFSPWEDIPVPDEFHRIRIDSGMRQAILNRSVHNQIENSYYQVKPDTVQGVTPADPYFGEIPVVYNLDEFTRFPTLRETFVEIVRYIWIRRDESGEPSFWVLNPEDAENTDYITDPPLVVVDGVLVPDRGKLLDFNARRIRSIRVLYDKLTLDNRLYQGMVAIETIGGDYLETWDSQAGTQFPYEPPAPAKQYYRQPEDAAQIPDFRRQLFWEPRIELDSPEAAFNFLTSDVPGRYEVRLEGYTSYGKPVSLQTYFEVTD